MSKFIDLRTPRGMNSALASLSGCYFNLNLGLLPVLRAFVSSQPLRGSGDGGIPTTLGDRRLGHPANLDLYYYQFRKQHYYSW